MKVAFGLKAHSGWAALVVLGDESGTLEVLDRRRIELVEEEWAKQPYHAAEELEPTAARKVVEKGIKAAHANAQRALAAAKKRVENEGHTIVACAVLMGAPMPPWNVDEILSVHFRMHKAEGVLFREALGTAAKACKLNLVTVPEKHLNEYAVKVLSTPLHVLMKRLTSLGKTAGPPWGKDQKEAALAAMVAFHS